MSDQLSFAPSSRLAEGVQDFSNEIVRSWRSFESFFEDASRLWAVSYCDSPKVVADLFDTYELESMELLAGNASDYRERLTGEDAGLVSRLERLRQSGRLQIYTCPRKTVHSKMYILGHGEGPYTLINGSANLTKNSWTNHTNYLSVWRAAEESQIFETFWEDYRAHVEDYGEPFLEDLTERLTGAEEEKRETVIRRWVAGRSSRRDEMEEITAKLAGKTTQQVPPETAPSPPKDTEPSEDINPSVDTGLTGESSPAIGTDELTSADSSKGAENPQSADGSEGTGDPESAGDSESSGDPGRAADPRRAADPKRAAGTGEGAPPRPDIRLSLNGYSQSAQEEIKDEAQTIGASTGPDSVTLSPGQVGTFLKRQFGIPGMWVEDGGSGAPKLYFASPGGAGRVLSSPPPESSDRISEALAHLERFLSTVDRHGQTNEPEAVKAHMLETLLYFFWAPFANEHAQAFLREGVTSLDKRLPFLYLQGESNSGKGTLLSFGLRLISGGAVAAPLDADNVGLSEVRRARKASSAFPFAVDDIEKSKIRQLGSLRNYWSEWEKGRRFPTMIFTSNDRRPKEWFRNRSKMLSLNVMFDPGPAAEGEVQQLIRAESPLFPWIADRLIRRYRNETVEIIGDVLFPVRKALAGLYDRAGRPRPGYFEMQPAEKRFDAGRQEWRRLAEDGRIEIQRRGEALYVTFDEELEHWEIGELKRKLPTGARAEQEGKRVVIRAPEQFKEWFGELPGGWLRRALGGLW